MKNKIGIGIIGTGSIADIHAKCIDELEHCELMAVCSSTPERAKLASIKNKVPAYSNFNDICSRDDIDLIIICKESGRHLEPTKAAAMSGKHVLTEKPLEVTEARANEMIAICKTQNVKLGCIFQNRFNKGFQQLITAVDDGAFGELIHGNAYINWYREPNYYKNSNWRGTLSGDGGAAFINQGIHTIDLLVNIMGDVNSVFAKVRTVMHDIEGEDFGHAMLTFKNGSSGSIIAATSLYPGYPERLEIYGSKGSAVLEAGEIVHWHLMGKSSAENNKRTNASSGFSNPMAINHHAHKIQINDMVEAIIQNREALISGQEALKSLSLIEAIYKSSAKNKEIHMK